ncbi:MAG: preprotein translocase subunit YajC [Bacteroidales bacterium]|nr:preprotein translocase subunit YajC [Bacteroidales bacterium]
MLDFILNNIGDWLMSWPRWTKTTIMVVLMIVIFYFFLIRPQTKQAKKEQAYRDSLQKGDRVMTAGGVHVTVVSVNGAKATVELAPGHQIKVQTATLQPIPERRK